MNQKVLFKFSYGLHTCYNFQQHVHSSNQSGSNQCYNCTSLQASIGSSQLLLICRKFFRRYIFFFRKFCISSSLRKKKKIHFLSVVKFIFKIFWYPITVKKQHSKIFAEQYTPEAQTYIGLGNLLKCGVFLQNSAVSYVFMFKVFLLIY